MTVRVLCYCFGSVLLGLDVSMCLSTSNVAYYHILGLRPLPLPHAGTHSQKWISSWEARDEHVRLKTLRPEFVYYGEMTVDCQRQI